MAKRNGALVRAQETFTPLVVQELASMEQQLGGRTELVGMLTLAPLTRDLRAMLGLLGDPTFGKQSLASICAMANILPGELLKHLEAAALLRGKVVSAQIIGKAIPAVVQDVMMRAAPYEGTCHTCQGTGTYTPEPTKETPNPAPEPCHVCQGMGKLIYPPDIEHQKLALEMGRLTSKGGGLSITQNVANLSGSGQPGGLGGGSLERLQAITDQILYHEDPLDADLVDPPEEPPT